MASTLRRRIPLIFGGAAAADGVAASSVGGTAIRGGVYSASGAASVAGGGSSLIASDPLPEGNGLAASYPDDSGITANAAVLFADTFESYTTASNLTSSGNWSNYFQGSNTTIDTGTFFDGAKAVRLRMPVSGSEVSNAIVKTISPDQDQLFVRVYTRFASNYAGFNPGGHNGIRITANYTGPGQIPSGTNFMLVNWEAVNYGDAVEPGKYRLYIYHPEQNDLYGENWYPSGRTTNGDGPNGGFGSNFVARSEIVPPRGEWICSELMVKLNTPGLRDGRVAVWEDGVLVADWGNIRFRDSTAVKLDEVQFENGSQASSQINDKWHDNVVIATQYIGPMLPATGSGGNTILATGVTQAAVQAAVNAASDGDTVLIPNGSATWTGGISTTKQIIIRAQNYTPTPAGTEGSGATSRNVTITNNSSSSLFSFTSGNSYHVGLGGIRFNEGSGNGAHLTLGGSGTKVPLIFDCYFQNKSRFFPAAQTIVVACRGGVMWNCMIEGNFDVNGVGEGSMLIKNSGGIRDWNTASTMGDADADGDVNFYFEDSTAKNVGNFPDIDDHGRYVARHFIYDGAWGETHGFTSTWGGRHWEFYDGIFRSTTTSRNLANRYFWCRAGTGIFADCVVNNATDTSSYGSISQLDIGDNTSPGSYPQSRQPGWGHNGSSNVIDPIYMWGNTGARADTWGTSNGWGSIVLNNREVYTGTTKPGYTKYTYPHPLRSVV